MPEQDAVFVCTGGMTNANMQIPLDAVWDILLPAMQPTSLPTDDTAHAKLTQTLANLTRTPQASSVAPPAEHMKKFVFAENDRKLESIELKRDDKSGDTLLTVRAGGLEQRIDCGKDAWKKGIVTWGALKDHPIAASGGWTAADTFKAQLCFCRREFTITLTLAFSGNEVSYSTETYPTKDTTKPKALVGKIPDFPR